ncbi:MAG: hypothetical protein QOH79_410 [Acidimicrobiaceae bacterium]
MPRSLGGRVRRGLVLLAVSAGVLALPSVATAAPAGGSTRHDMLTLRQVNATGSPAQAHAAAAPATGNNGIKYHGGPVILGTTHVYVIWYGNWPSSSTTPAIITTLLNNIGGSPYFNINTTYFNATRTRVTNSVALLGSINDSYSQGNVLTDAGVKTVVASAITANKLPSDANGLYFVLTSSDVAEPSGFLTQYCGWHDHGSIGGKDIKYSFVGDASLDPSACMAQSPQSPNGNAAADGMASVIAHELEETTTDPDLNAWYDGQGMENADKCAWTFGKLYTANGAKANMKFGGHDYLIQRNWVNASGGFCALRF